MIVDADFDEFKKGKNTHEFRKQFLEDSNSNKQEAMTIKNMKSGSVVLEFVYADDTKDT